MDYRSVFGQRFEVAIYGCGYAGLAAAWKLARQGTKVLLFDRRMDVAWESGRSFASDAGICDDPLWQDFLADLQSRQLYKEGIIDSAGAEIVAASRLNAAPENLQVLLNAWPMQAQMAENQIDSIAVATKSGLQTLHAAHWIDASEEATLFRLAFPEPTLRAPSHFEHRAILFCNETTDERVATPAPITPEITLEKRVWNNELALCLRSDQPLSLKDVLRAMDGARAKLKSPLSEAAIAALSVVPFPIYAAVKSTFETTRNLIAASPACSAQQIDSLGARFALGVEAAAQINENSAVSASDFVMRTLPQRREQCDVFIAGTGTSGALAAMAAQQEGAAILCSDAMPFAGGVGSGGQINSYFHGESGGMFEQFDAQALDVGKVLSPHKPGRGHETKKIAFEQNISASDAVFLPEAFIYEVTAHGGKIHALKLVSPHEVIEVIPRAVIDCTGDGDVAALAGAEFDFGRAGDGFPLSYSQPCLHVRGTALRTANFDAGWCDPTDPEDLTRARLAAIAQYLSDEFTDDLHLVALAPILGLRQSRQIRTEEQLSLAAMLSHHRQEFSIGQTRSPLDTHSVDYEFEDDETMFWLWGCKSFRESTFAEIPYGALVPKDFENLWIACRAAGIAPAAAYAARMQRDMQRIGEAAGYAAAMAVRDNVGAMAVPRAALQAKLRESGALAELVVPTPAWDELLVQFDTGIPGAYLWDIYQNPARFENAITERLSATNADISWLAAGILAMRSDSRGQPRLIHAIETREKGVDTPPAASGPFGQWIDVPNWFLAINLLRRCGDAMCLPALYNVARQADNILNLRTSLALTVAAVAPRLDHQAKEAAERILKVLLQDAVRDTCVRPSRSIYRALLGEPQKPLPQEPAWVDTREDHSWRLDFAVTKATRALGVEDVVDISKWRCDRRALVRRAFASFV